MTQNGVCIDCLTEKSHEQKLCYDCLPRLTELEDLTKQLLPQEIDLLNLYKSSEVHPWSFYYIGPDGWTGRESYSYLATLFAQDHQRREQLLNLGLEYVVSTSYSESYIFDLGDCITFLTWVQDEGLPLVSVNNGSKT